MPLQTLSVSLGGHSCCSHRFLPSTHPYCFSSTLALGKPVTLHQRPNLVVLIIPLIKQHRTVLLMGTRADLTSTLGSSSLDSSTEPWCSEEHSRPAEEQCSVSLVQDLRFKGTTHLTVSTLSHFSTSRKLSTQKAGEPRFYLILSMSHLVPCTFSWSSLLRSSHL